MPSFKTIDQRLRKSVAQGIAPGMVLAFGQEDRPLFCRAYGRATSIPHPEPLTTATLFDLASLTKVLGTTLLAMRLHQEGRLDLDRPLGSFRPRAYSADLAALTPRLLLAHASGLPASIPLHSGREADPADPAGLSSASGPSSTIWSPRLLISYVVAAPCNFSAPVASNAGLRLNYALWKRGQYMRLLPILLSAGLLWSGLNPAHGTTLVRFSLEDLAGHAERAFLGRCTAAETVLIDDRVYTRIRFQVDEMLKGDTAAEVVVHLAGGRYQDRRVHLAGMPSFAPDEAVVLFLTQGDRLGHPWPVGLGQGKFTVRQSAGQSRVFQQLRGIQLKAPSQAAKAAVPTTAYDGMPLEQFLDRVRALVGSQPAEALHAR